MIENPGQEEEGEEDKRSPCLQTLYKLHLRMFKPKKVELNTTEKVLELLQPVRYKPTSVAEMAEEMRERIVADHLYCNSGLTRLSPGKCLPHCFPPSGNTIYFLRASY